MSLNDLLIVFGVPIVMIAFFVLPRMQHGLNMADEGYLVLGTQRVIAGRVPIRDFRAYDPGRYYYCALFCLVFESDFRAVRLAMAFATFGSLAVVSVTVLDASKSPLLASLTCVLALIWLQPRFKQIENFFCLVTVALLYGLTLPAPTVAPLLVGLAIGASAVFGLNVLIYMTGSTLLVCLAVVGWNVTNWPIASISALVGFAIGISPVVALILLVRGYFKSYVARKVFPVLKRGSTNLKGPLPWFWSHKTSLFDYGRRRRSLALKSIFNLLPVACCAVVAFALWNPSSAGDPLLHLALVASLVSLVSFHHAMSRADMEHLFLSALPFLIALSAVLASILDAELSSAIVLLLAVGSTWLVWMKPEDPFSSEGRYPHVNKVMFGRQTFWLPKNQGVDLKAIEALIERYTKPRETLLAVPILASVYALSNREQAAFDTFPVYPSTQQARDVFLNDLESAAPKLVLISRHAVDDRLDLIFLNNYPNVRTFLDKQYTRVASVGHIDAFVRNDIHEQ